MSVISQANEILGDVQGIRTAIVNKGGTVSTLNTFAQAITDLPTGVDPSDANATEDTVLKGKTFYAGTTTIRTGTMCRLPSLPTTWTDLDLNATITLARNGFLYYQICYKCGYGQYSYLTVGSVVIQFEYVSGTEEGDCLHKVWGYYPYYKGTSVCLTTYGGGSVASNSFLKIGFVD